MQFDHRVQIELPQEGGGIELMVARIGVEIVQVKQQPTAAVADQRIEERRFAHLLIAEGHISDGVLTRNGEGKRGRSA